MSTENGPKKGFLKKAFGSSVHLGRELLLHSIIHFTIWGGLFGANFAAFLGPVLGPVGDLATSGATAVFGPENWFTSTPGSLPAAELENITSLG